MEEVFMSVRVSCMKIFTKSMFHPIGGEAIALLENEVNYWIASKSEDKAEEFQVVDRKLTVTDTREGVVYTIAIFYQWMSAV
jgi:hypothetical protein